MNSMSDSMLGLLTSLGYLLIPLLMLIAVIMMARKVPGWIYACLLAGSLMRIFAMAPHIAYTIGRVLGTDAAPVIHFFQLASIIGLLGGMVFAAGLLGLAVGMPFASKRP